MIRVALYQPEIPPNTGNIIRLCANTGAELHLIHPLGFHLNEKSVRRAGLDYAELAHVREHHSLDDLRRQFADARIFAFTTRGRQRYDRARYRSGDILLFGPETRGLPESVIGQIPESQRLLLPMRPGSRSLNLSNAAAIAVYEAWRQLDFAPGGDES
ncbi:MAG: tRNA (cytidine(34)-2'-O)-methyltransferase [Nevskiales bacterium]|nr:tRNA (cytidine(34)-2'-O)-methyltransferase [Nevskiales bacterium]